MSPRFFFPFIWGSPSVDTVTVPPAPPPRWSNLGSSAQNWGSVHAAILPRFQHIYPQESGGEQQFRRLSAVT